MIRLLYRCLLRLHPRAFREEFTGEMLWIFDESAKAEGALPFFADSLVSLARQWLLRAGTWKIAVGAASSFLLIGGMMSLAALPPHRVAGLPSLPYVPSRASAARIAPAQFSGHWAGRLNWPAPVGLMELTLTDLGEAWSGEFQVRGPDGVLHSGPTEDIRFEDSAVLFRVKTAHGDLKFRGTIAHGTLVGSLEPPRTATF